MAKEIIWITGRPGTGKTTLAKEICRRYKKCILLDSDELRWAFNNKGYSEFVRSQWVLQVAKLARLFAYRGFTPVVAIVSPDRLVRHNVFKGFLGRKNVTLIYLPGGHQNMWEGTWYDEPTSEEAGRFFQRKYTIS